MKRTALLGLLGALWFMTTFAHGGEEPRGIIGRVYEDGNPVIYKFVNEMPQSDVRAQFPWLAIIAWRYDGAANNGMPASSDNERMIRLEEAVGGIERQGVLHHAFSRTGNSVKELVYYIQDREQFLDLFNRAVRTHPRYPIEITFYEDPKWQEFQRLLDDFAGAANNALQPTREDARG